MTGVHVDRLMDPGLLAEAVRERLVLARRHPTFPITIYSYSTKAQWSRAWTPVTVRCRGLVVHDDGRVLARGWDKFFELSGAGSGLDPDVEVEATDKLDGSFVLLIDDLTVGPAFMCTRSGFANTQSVHATALWRSRYAGRWDPPVGWTVLFEVLFPANRIVVDYGPLDDLVLLGAVRTATGEAIGPQDPLLSGWPGPRTAVLFRGALADALALPSRPGTEGMVLRVLGTAPAVLAKVKERTYKDLHFRLTETSERDVWERMAVDRWAPEIDRADGWARDLGIDPAKGERLRPSAGSLLTELAEGVPDEFHSWLRRTESRIQAEVDAGAALVSALAVRLRQEHGQDRRAAFESTRDHPAQKAVMRLLGGGSMRNAELWAWRRALPAGELKAWGASAQTAGPTA